MWQIGVALLSGISAKEVVVSSFAVLFGVANANSAEGMAAIVENIHMVNPSFGPLNAYCLMLFCLLYVPCVATVATIKKGERLLEIYFENDCLSADFGLGCVNPCVSDRKPVCIVNHPNFT